MRTLLLHFMAACLLFGQAREIGRAVEVVTQPVVRLGRGAITDIDWSPDDRWFVTTGQAGTVQLWDNWYGTRVRDFVGHTGSCLNVGFGPDGTWVWSLANDATFRRWDVATGRELSCMPVVRNPGSCNVNSSGTLLVVTNRDWPSNAYIYNLTSETLTTSFTMITHHDLCRSMFGPHSSRLEVQDGEYILDYDWMHGAFLNYRRGYAQRFDFADSDHLLMGLYGVLDTDTSTQSTVLSPVGTTLHAAYLSQTNSGAWWIKHASGDVSNYRLHIANLSGLADERIIPGIADEGVRLKASGDGKMLYFAGQNGHVYAWDIATGALVRDFDVQNGEFSSVQILPEGDRAVTMEKTGHWTLYRLPDGEELQQGNLMPDPPPATVPTFGVRCARSGQWLVLFNSIGQVRLLNLDDPQRNTLLLFSGETLQDVQLSPSGGRLAVVGVQHIWFYDTTNLMLLNQLTLATAPMPRSQGTYLSFANENEFVAAWSHLSKYESSSGKIIETYPYIGVNEYIGISPDAQRILGVGTTNRVALWDNTLKKVLWEKPLSADQTFKDVGPFGFTPDAALCWITLGRLAPAIGTQSEMLLLNSITGETVREYNPPGGGVDTLAISADGQYVATATQGVMYVYAAPQNSTDGAWSMYE